MNPLFFTTLFAIGLFLGIFFLLEIGRRIGIRRITKDPEGAKAGVGAVEGAVFGLLGLLIAFTFSGAAARFDARRQAIIEETNAIGTAYLRIDLLPPSAQPGLREDFRQYVDARLETYRKLPDLEAARKELAKAQKLQNKIWTYAVAASQEKGAAFVPMLLLPALNQMIDITTTRTIMAQIHPPLVVFAMLGVLVLATSLLIGYDMAAGKTRNWVHIFVLAVVMAFSVYVIMDIEYPRLGLIRVDAFDQALIELRQSMQ